VIINITNLDELDSNLLNKISLYYVHGVTKLCFLELIAHDNSNTIWMYSLVSKLTIVIISILKLTTITLVFTIVR